MTKYPLEFISIPQEFRDRTSIFDVQLPHHAELLSILTQAQQQLVKIVPTIAPILTKTPIYYFDYGGNMSALDQCFWYSSLNVSTSNPIRGSNIHVSGFSNQGTASPTFWISSKLELPPTTTLHIDITKSHQQPHTQVIIQINQSPTSDTQRLSYSFTGYNRPKFQDLDSRVLSLLRIDNNQLTLPFCHAMFNMLCTTKILDWNTLEDFSSTLAELPIS